MKLSDYYRELAGWTPVIVKTGDCAERQLITVYVYGAQHTYLMCKRNFGAVASQSSNSAVGTRFE